MISEESLVQKEKKKECSVHLRPGSQLENGPQQSFATESLGTSVSRFEFNMATLVKQLILAPAAP